MEPVTSSRITVTVNGEEFEYDVDARRLLVHFLRDDLDLTGTHVGCDTGNCGACTVIYNGVLAKSCMLLAIQADGASIETVERPGERRRADEAAAGVLGSPRAPVRLLHAGDAHERDGAAAREQRADRGADPQGDPGKHLPLHGLREHRRGDQGGGEMTETVTQAARRRARRDEGRLRRHERPAQGGQAARPGRGRLLRRREAARDGLRPLRPLAVRAREDRLDRRLEGARARRRLRNAHRRRGGDPHRSVLRALGKAGRRHQGLRARGAPRPPRRRAGRGRRRVIARARARRRGARRGRVRAAAGPHDAESRRSRTR